LSGSGTGIVTPYNTHRGMDFDGAADRYLRGGALTGAADGPLMTMSQWFRVDGGDGAIRWLTQGTGSRFALLITAANQIQLLCRTVVPLTILEFITTPTYLAGSGWHHLMASCDLTVPTASIWVDGAQPALGTNTVVAGNIDFTVVNWAYGGRIPAALWWNGGLSEGYYNFAEYFDLTLAVNREFLRHPNGQPPNIGAQAQLVTGNQPIMYMVEEGGVLVNRGYGGAFVAVGAPALSADSPKDRWVASLRHRRRKRRRHAA